MLCIKKSSQQRLGRGRQIDTPGVLSGGPYTIHGTQTQILRICPCQIDLSLLFKTNLSKKFCPFSIVSLFLKYIQNFIKQLFQKPMILSRSLIIAF